MGTLILLTAIVIQESGGVSLYLLYSENKRGLKYAGVRSNVNYFNLNPNLDVGYR